MKGARKILSDTELIIVEMSVIRRFEGELLLSDFVANMASLGFEFFNVVSLNELSPGGPLAYVDAVFVNRDSKLLCA